MKHNKYFHSEIEAVFFAIIGVAIALMAIAAIVYFVQSYTPISQ